MTLTRQIRRPRWTSAPLAIRTLSSSCHRRGHYETLGLSHDATKSQIKSRFYQLSKRYHPDVSDDPDLHRKFQVVTEAYTVLSNDRQRRAYDRSLGYARPSGRTGSSTVLYESRRRGATHAWESHRRPTYHRPHPRTHQGKGGSTSYEPNASKPSKGTAWRQKNAPEDMEADRVRGESSFWRAMQIIGLVLVITTVGGGLRRATG